MYVHSSVPEGEEIVYLEVVGDIRSDKGRPPSTIVIPKGSISWVRKSKYATHLKNNILIIEDNRHQFNFHKDCFKKIPNPYVGKETKKEEYKFSIGQEVQIRDDSAFSGQGRSIDGTKLKGKISEHEEDSEFKYRVRWQKNSENIYRDEDLEPYQEPEIKTKPHGFKVGDAVKIRKDSVLLSHGEDKDGNRKVGLVDDLPISPKDSFNVKIKFIDSTHNEWFRLEDLEHCTEPYPEEEEEKGVNIGKNSIIGIDPATPGDSSSLMSYRAVTLDLQKEEKKLHPDVSRMKSI